jgi:pimeloyl-ACP methyl ester carboxylesterase
VTVGGHRDGDGWRWKLDPGLRFGGFGPWRPEWSLERLPGLAVPLLAVVGLAPEPMGMGATPASLQPYLPPGARLEALDDVGHFVHIEQPERVAGLVLEFLR